MTQKENGHFLLSFWMAVQLYTYHYSFENRLMARVWVANNQWIYCLVFAGCKGSNLTPWVWGTSWVQGAEHGVGWLYEGPAIIWCVGGRKINHKWSLKHGWTNMTTENNHSWGLCINYLYNIQTDAFYVRQHWGKLLNFPVSLSPNLSLFSNLLSIKWENCMEFTSLIWLSLLSSEPKLN